DLTELRREQGMRRAMPTRSWVLENVQRDAQRRHEHTDGEHIRARADHVLDLEDARRILERESTLDRTIRAEPSRRHAGPDPHRALPEPTEGPAHDRADLEQLRSRLAPAPGAPAKSRGVPLPSLKERVAAQRAAEGTSRLSEGQKRADDQMRQRLAQQARDREQGKGPVQR